MSYIRSTAFSLVGALLLLNGCSSNSSSEKTNSIATQGNDKKSELTAKYEQAINQAQSVYGNLIDASEAKKISDQKTGDIAVNLLKSEKGKKVYMTLIQTVDQILRQTAQNGAFDIANINGLNSPQVKIIKTLSEEEQSVMKNLIEAYLLSKGYSVSRGQYDILDFHFLVSWSKSQENAE